jgi:hypothetical protein
MFNLNLQLLLIKHLQAYNDGFFRSFAGSSSPGLAMSQLNGDTPALIVVPRSFAPTEQSNLVGLKQRVTWTFDIVVALDASRDPSRAGASGALTVEDVFWKLYGMLAGWVPPISNTNPKSVYLGTGFTPGEVVALETNGAKSYWTFPYSVTSTIGDQGSWKTNQIYQAQPGVVSEIGNTIVEVVSNGTVFSNVTLNSSNIN